MIKINYRINPDGDLIFTETEFKKILKYRFGYDIEEFHLLIGGGIKLICTEEDREFNKRHIQAAA